MQRIRETSRGLQLTEGLDVITLENYGGGIGIYRKESGIVEAGNAAHVIVDGNDNIRDFAEWLVKQSADVFTEQESEFCEYTVDSHTLASCIAVEQPKDEKTLALHELYEKAGVLIGLLTDLLGDEYDEGNRLDVQAFATPFGYKQSLQPIAIAKLRNNELVLSRDENLYRYTRIPVQRANDLGNWILNGLNTVKPKSIWG